MRFHKKGSLTISICPTQRFFGRTNVYCPGHRITMVTVFKNEIMNEMESHMSRIERLANFKT